MQSSKTRITVVKHLRHGLPKVAEPLESQAAQGIVRDEELVGRDSGIEDIRFHLVTGEDSENEELIERGKSPNYYGNPESIFGSQEHDAESDQPRRRKDKSSILRSSTSSSASDSEPQVYQPAPARKATQVKTLKRKRSSRNGKGGRYKDTIWNSFYETADMKGKVEWKCKACDEVVSARAERFKNHLKKCGVKADGINSEDVSEHGKMSAPASTSKTSENQPTIKESFFKLKTQHDTISHKLAKFIYGCNLSFRIVEHPLFQEFVKALRPSYKLPSRKEIAGPYLDEIYNELLEQVKSEVAGKQVAILQDGWSTNQTAPVIAHSISTGAKDYFIQAEPTGTTSKTSEHCKFLMDNQITRLENEFGCEVIGTVNDSCNVMKRMRELIQLDRGNDFFVYGCHSHYLNLVGQDLTPVELRTSIVEVQKFFRNHHYASQELARKQGLRPTLPGSTRWNSQFDCFENYLKNQTKYLEIARDPQAAAPPAIKQIIMDEQVYQEARAAVTILRPVAYSLDKLQADKATLADAVHCWITLYKTLEQHYQADNPKFKKRLQDALSPLAIAAYMLHPKYRGASLSEIPPEYKRMGQLWLSKRSSLFLVAAMSLSAEDETFYPKSYLDPNLVAKINPSVWWNQVGQENRLPIGLCTLAQKLMKLPASSAGLERAFSTLSYIFGKLRNNLSLESASKLCFVYQYLKKENFTVVYMDEEDLD